MKKKSRTTKAQEKSDKQAVTVTCSERVDMSILCHIKENDFLITGKEDKENFCRYFDYVTKKDGVHSVVFSKKEYGVGRKYEDHTSMQSLNRKLRHTIAKRTHVDIDIVNCNPVIALQLCQKSKWKCKTLKEYVTSRDECLGKVMEKYLTTREAAKDLYIRLMNGGGYEKWKEKWNIQHIESDELTNELVSFQSEMKEIRKKVFNDEKYSNFKEIALEKAKRKPDAKKTPDATAFSLLIHDIEDSIVDVILKCCIANRWQVSTLVFDGLMLERQKGLTSEEHDKRVQSLLRLCEKQVLKETKYTIKLEQKDMNSGFEIPENIDQINGGGSLKRLLFREGCDWLREYVVDFLVKRCILSANPNIVQANNELEALFRYLARSKVLDCCTDEEAVARLGLDQSVQEKWRRIRGEESSHSMFDSAWIEPIIELEKWSMKVSEKVFCAHGVLQDLDCPLSIEHLLETSEQEVATWLIPKVLGRITSKATDSWIKRLRYTDGTVRFADIKDVQKQFRAQVKSRFDDENAVQLDRLIIEEAQKQGHLMNFSEIDFYPYTPENKPELPQRTLNIFGGFPCKEIKDKSFEDMDWKPIQPVLKMIKKVICREDELLWKYWCSWHAQLLQQPAEKPRVCLVYFSPKQQIGKGLVATKILETLVGRGFNQVEDENHILGDFTGKLAQYFAFAIDESEKGGVSKQKCGRLKNRISEATCSITYKGLDPFTMRSCHRFVYCVNYLDCLDIELHDQRFVIFDCDPCYQGNKDFFQNIGNCIQQNRSLLWNYFKKYPLEKQWNKKVPMTQVKQQMLQKKYPTALQFISECSNIWKGQHVYENLTVQDEVQEECLADDFTISWHWQQLYQVYRNWARDFNVETGVYTKSASLKEACNRIGFIETKDKGRVTIDKKKDSGFKMQRAELVTCIRAFLKNFDEEGADEWCPPDKRSAN